MFKITIKNEITNHTFNGVFPTLEELNEWKNFCIQNNIWGQAERVSELNNLPADRIIKSEVSNNRTLYTLKADYTLTITDLSQDKDFLLQKCYEAREAGYGSIADQLDLIYHSGISSWQAHIAQVKASNPKPI